MLLNLYSIRNILAQGKKLIDLPLRVTYYARVSTDRDEQLNSLENQVMYFENYIKSQTNWIFVKGYVDEGISGTSVNKRDNFLKMIKDAKDGYFDLILTKEISRFSRNTVDSIKYTQELLENDVGVLFLSDNINTILPDSELRLTIMSSIAQEEVRKLSERVRFGMKRSKEKGVVLGNNAITGYTKNKGKLEINEKEAILIRKIYSMYASGEYGLAKISKKLYNEGYKTKKGDFIHITTLRRIITNPKYKGFYCTNTVMTKDYKNKKQIRLPMEEWIIKESNGEIPAIVSEELWDKANEILENAGWKKKGLYREKDGQVLSIDMHYIGIDPKQKAMAEIIQADLMQAGIKLNLVAEESTIFYSLQANGSFDMIFNKTWGPPFDPGTFAGSMRKPSHADYQAQSGLKEKADIDNMISQLIISDNNTFIAEKYKEILNIFHNEAVYLPISYELDLALVRKDRVKNFQFGNMVTEFMLHTLEPYND